MERKLGAVSLALVAASAMAGAQIDVQTQVAKLTAGDAAFGHEFGSSVAISGDTLAVGSYDVNFGLGKPGAVYVFVRDGAGWSQQAEFTDPDGIEDDAFGRNLSLSGDVLIVGALGAPNASGEPMGAAYIYARTGSIWALQARLTASDGSEYDGFGSGVAVQGDRALVGAFGHVVSGVDPTGAAYVFERNGTDWIEKAELTAPDALGFEEFGITVSLSGDSALVGADNGFLGGPNENGQAYVFVDSGGHWTLQAKLTASDGAAADFFGQALSLSGDSALIGAPAHSVPWSDKGGVAYVFTRSGTLWTQQQELFAVHGSLNDSFGESVAISGGTAVVAWSYRDSNPGAAPGYTALRLVRSGTTWIPTQRLGASDAPLNDLLSVALDGETAVVGAPLADLVGKSGAGAAYVYTFADGPWTSLADGLAGTNGVPGLVGTGSLLGGTTGSLELKAGKPSGPAMLFGSVSSTPIAFKGGTLVPFPALLAVPLVTQLDGTLTLPFTWPAGISSGTSFWFQIAISDPVAMQGVALSNALEATTP